MFRISSGNHDTCGITRRCIVRLLTDPGKTEIMNYLEQRLCLRTTARQYPLQLDTAMRHCGQMAILGAVYSIHQSEQSSRGHRLSSIAGVRGPTKWNL